MLGSKAHLVARYLDLLSLQQRVTATNVANVDTPGYRTKGIDFAAAMRAVLDDPSGGSTVGLPHVQEVDGLPVKNDGNDVILERELETISETAIRFSHALLMLRGSIRSVRNAIHEGRLQ